MVRFWNSIGSGGSPPLVEPLLSRGTWREMSGRQVTAPGWTGGMIASLVLAAIVATSFALLDNRASQTALAEFEPRPLSREWQWERDAVSYEHMFRQSEPTPGSTLTSH